MSHGNRLDKVTKKAISKMIENLGPNIKEAQYEVFDFSQTFSSYLYYIRVIFKNDSNDQSEELSLVLKRINPDEFIKQFFCNKIQFHNEVLFYKMYVQTDDDNFPRCFYADDRSPTDAVIVLENVSKRSYSICPYKYDAPIEYTLAAMREIGRFHGKGYAMKEQQSEKFFDIVKRIIDPRYTRKKIDYTAFFNVVAIKVVKYLRNHGHDAVFCDKMEVFLSNAFDNVIMKAIEPLEPLSTLCHGDFTLNNMLFKMHMDGHCRAMLIDFADIRYATPAIDLSTYFCICCPNELKKDKFFDILKVYHIALQEYLLEAGVGNIERYSYDALLNDFKKGSLFGLLIASGFLPLLRGYYVYVKSSNVMSVTEWAETMNQSGGEEISKILADTLLNLKDIGCLEHIL